MLLFKNNLVPNDVYPFVILSLRNSFSSLELVSDCSILLKLKSIFRKIKILPVNRRTVPAGHAFCSSHSRRPSLVCMYDIAIVAAESLRGLPP